MSWTDVVENLMVITFGNGDEYRVIWLNARQSVDYNVTEFNFPQISGTLVKKFKPIGRKFPLEFYFTGDANVDQAELFRISANDERPVVIQHPYYGVITCQLTALEQDNSAHNLTKFTCIALETIQEDNPQTSIPPFELIPIKVDNLTTILPDKLIETPINSDVITMNQTNAKAYKSGVKIITDPAQAEEYFNAFNTATTYINTAVATPVLAMRSAINVLLMPARFTASVKNRLGVLVDTFNTLRSTLFGLIAVSSKQIFQNEGAAVICAICETAASPLPNNYRNSRDVVDVMDIIKTSYNQFISDLDSIQGANGGNPIFFVPDPDVMEQLNTVVVITISNLYDIALNGLRERTFVCDKDTNLIILGHRFYQNFSDDLLIQIQEQNEIGLNEILQIRKGRKIIYFV